MEWEVLQKNCLTKILQEGNGFSRIGHDGTNLVEKKKEKKEI